MDIEEIVDVVKALEEYKKYNKLEFYEPYDYQIRFHHMTGYGDFVPAPSDTKQSHLAIQRALMAANQIGKEQANHSLVATPNGWVEIGSLKIGDQVLGGDGKPCNVLGVFPQGRKLNYRITFDDDSSTLAGKNHLWRILAPKRRFDKLFNSRKKVMEINPHFNEWGVIDTGTIIERWGFNPKPVSRAAIPVTEAYFNKNKLSIDPYLLGAIIGDGGISQGVVGFTTADEDIISSLNVPDGCYIKKTKTKYQYSFVSDRQRNPLIGLLKEYGLMGKLSHEKFVPNDYLIASYEDRRQLLCGLMDTDGTVGASNGCIEFSTTSEQLAKDVQYLFRSLGMKCKIMSRTTRFTHKGEKKTGRLSYRVRPRWNGVKVFNLERKHERCFIPESTTQHRLIYKIEEEGEFESTCIMVDSEDHTYITDDFIVTHNTVCGAAETAMHLTGLYPDWWEGHRFEKPIKALIGSNTNETARDICQRELFGDPSDDRALGSGFVPKKCIEKTNRKPGVNNAFDSVLVKHTSGGNSEVYFRAYEQGAKKFMGHRYDFAWADEEPPPEIQSQIARSQFATNGIEAITFTPEEGITDVVRNFLQDLKPGQALIRATWDDAPHMTPELREQKLAGVPSHEREMRSRGEPLMGSGLVFSVARETLECDPFEIPAHWPRINGIDFGWDHPFACSFVAWDRETDTVYVYDGYKEQRTLPPMHAEAIKRRGEWIPVSWPKDGLQAEKGSGKPLADKYRELGIKMHWTYFTNPPSPGEQEGKGSMSVESGILEMLEMMETGRFKVFKNVTMFWEELGMYHRKDGKIVPFNDDFISATRYAVMARRHAEVKVVRQPKQQTYRGLSNW